MPNEKITKEIVRDHFSKFEELVCVEEQRSVNSKIDRLLKNASKNGMGQDCIDFIISYKDCPDLLIIVKCKADRAMHESNDRKQYSDYAVDGALLYASHLSQSFDVLAIAVSGQTEQELIISHFLHLKGEKKDNSIFGDELLSPKDYLKGYLESPEKFRQDYDKLLDFTKTLNSKLHTNKILESERSLLISAILIALDDDAFIASYTKHNAPEDLAITLVKTVSAQLRNASMVNNDLKSMETQLSFITTDTSLAKTDNILKEIIDDIDQNINSFIKNHQYFDVLGQLYIEFLRYANSDKGLGIVLTPPHITEFFVELAKVNKNSVVYDNCTGTGGFLISSMQKMIKDAKGNSAKIKNIKEQQLFGVEYQAHIFALAVSNMCIHKDGKTSIINGSCFDKKIVDRITNKHPTAGFLNPPYKSNKANDTDELEFILNNLECLTQGGTCVAIVPMQSALAKSGKVFELKKQLLEDHTLEAVLSMPNELFFNSKVSVVSCIMVFTAHKSHPKNKETYFGYYKDDGYVKRKNKGRIDACDQWEKIREKWLSGFMNRKSEPGFAVAKIVTADSEWVAEVYMETDYSTLTKKYFEDYVLKYMIFLLGNRISVNCYNTVLEQISLTPISVKNLDIKTNEWQKFKLIDWFEIKGSRTTPLLELEEYGMGEYPYVTTQATNNGVRGFYTHYTEKGGVITVDSAVTGYCAYQELPFSASDHVEKLIPKFEINTYIATFLVAILNMEQYRYNYGIKCSQARMKEMSIKLPAKNDAPDFKYMEDYIKSLQYSSAI